MKLSRVSRRIGFMLACVLMVSPAYGMGAGTPASTKGPDVKGPGVVTEDRNRRQKDADAGLPGLALETTRGGDRAPVTPTDRSPWDRADQPRDTGSRDVRTGERDRVIGDRTGGPERFSELDRDVERFRRRSADLRTETEELKELRTRDPVAYDRRVAEETRKLDERDARRRAGTGGLDDSLRAIADDIESHDGSAPRTERERTEETRPVRTETRDPARDTTRRDPRYGRRVDAPTEVGVPVDMGRRVPIDRAGPLGGAPGASVDMPWWKVFLMKLIEICGKGLSLLMGRKLGEVDMEREAIVTREAGTDPARRAEVDARLRRAIADGYSTSPSRIGDARDTRRAPVSRDRDAGLPVGDLNRGRTPVRDAGITEVPMSSLPGLDGR